MRFVALLRWKGEADFAHPLFSAHARHMDALYAAGSLVLGGPFGDGAGAMVILETPSLEAARAQLEADPACGLMYAYDLHPWENMWG